MKKKEKNLQPLKITKDCIQAVINFDSVAVIRSDHSLWLLHPFTSRMCMKLQKRQREGKQPYWDEKEFGPKPKFKKLMENAEESTHIRVQTTSWKLFACVLIPSLM